VLFASSTGRWYIQKILYGNNILESLFDPQSKVDHCSGDQGYDNCGSADGIIVVNRAPASIALRQHLSSPLYGAERNIPDCDSSV
jgi:hypothetical protein